MALGWASQIASNPAAVTYVQLTVQHLLPPSVDISHKADPAKNVQHQPRSVGWTLLTDPGGLGSVWHLFSRTERKPARVPDGLRVYAVGDVHGRADLLEQVLSRIDLDVMADPSPRTIQVFLGDYVDRGPSSRQVLDRLVQRQRSHELVCLSGNHETFVVDFLKNPAILSDWRNYGGLETLMSYGLAPAANTAAGDYRELASAFARVLPQAHWQFLQTLQPYFDCGDYFFVHAGVRPGIPLPQQRLADMLWIREDFLLNEYDFGKIIVHGHTPVMEPEVRPNRINIDTGAYATGRLTCLRLEQDRLDFV